MFGTNPSFNKIWNRKAKRWLRDAHAFFNKEGGTRSGPPAERALSFLIIHETKQGLKIIDDRPVIFADGVAYQVEYDYR